MITKLCVFIVLISLISHVYACEKNRNIALEEIAAKESSQCNSDKECVAISADCCGCTSGGKQQVVHSSMAKSMSASIKQACGQTMCIKMISNDESCKKLAACVDGQCILR